MAEYTPSNFLEPTMPVAPGLYDINHEDAENIPVEGKAKAAAEIQPPDDLVQDNPYLEIAEKISHRNNALFKVALWKMFDRDKSGAADQKGLWLVPPWPFPTDKDSQNTLGTQWKMLRLEKDLEAWPLTRQFIANTPDTELNEIPSLKNIEEVIQSDSPKNQIAASSKGMTKDEIAARWMERSVQVEQKIGQPESPLEKGEESLWLPDSVTNAYTGNTLSKGARQVLEDAMRKGIVKLPPPHGGYGSNR